MNLIEEWPTDEVMAELCFCGHTFGQHAYGDDYAPCDQPDNERCGCRMFWERGDVSDVYQITQ